METSLQPMQELNSLVAAPVQKVDTLVEEAKSVLRKAMLNGDRKEATKIALEIYRDEKNGTMIKGTQINIADSQVQLIINTLKEL